ncbi:hypothetical protein MG293_004695 [Ovis ammon polii]|uniref:Uncharacterized protein n=1 Tax=Ovis ammon polii TaxID=230172 RepID=A0AAD4UIL4_OVIAM|nr:hypothetical protein MG293_004695 [Ovis ammon polii]
MPPKDDKRKKDARMSAKKGKDPVNKSGDDETELSWFHGRPPSSSSFTTGPSGLSSTLYRDWIPSHLESHWGQEVPFNKTSSSPAQKTADLLLLQCRSTCKLALVLHHETCMNDPVGRAPQTQQPTALC